MTREKKRECFEVIMNLVNSLYGLVPNDDAIFPEAFSLRESIRLEVDCLLAEVPDTNNDSNR